MKLWSTVNGSQSTVLTVNRRPLTVNRRKAFALIEVLVAVLFIAIFMLVLLQIRNQTIRQFIISGDQHTGAWLAEMKMAELISQDLPDPEDDTTWVTSDYGDFGYLDDRINSINANIQEGWEDRVVCGKFEFEWTKELLFIGPNFIGDREDLDMWEQPLDESGEPIIGESDPLEKPAARVVRVTLIVYLPEKRYNAGDEERDTTEERPTIKLVTYVDPAVLFNAEADTEETPAPEGP